MNVNELHADTDFLCGSTSASYPVASKIRNYNIARQTVATIIWESQGDWAYDDSNETTLPLAKTTMVHGQKDYTIPPTSQRIEGVIVLNKDGQWVTMKPINLTDAGIALPEFLPGTGMPIYYRPVGRSVELYPTPSSAYATLASGLGVYVSREPSDLPVTATTTTLGFATGYHRFVSYSAAIDFIKDPEEKRSLVAQRDRIQKGMVRFYAKRFVQSQGGIVPSGRKKWRRYT